MQNQKITYDIDRARKMLWERMKAQDATAKKPTYEQMAELVGCHAVTLQKLNKKGNKSLDILQSIADVAGTDVSNLIIKTPIDDCSRI